MISHAGHRTPTFDEVCASITQEPPELEAIRRAMEASGESNAMPSAGKLLALLTTLTRARRILDIGAGVGYSAGWFLQALPADGHLHALEVDRERASLARANLRTIDPGGEESGRWTVEAGPAVRSLHQLTWNRLAPFDVVLVDADPASAETYMKWALRLTTPGSVVVLRGLNVVEEEDDASSVRASSMHEDAHEVYSGTGMYSSGVDVVSGIYGALRLMRDDPRFAATAFPTLEHRASTGMAIAVITAASPPASAGLEVRVEPMTLATVRDALKVKNQGWRETYDKHLTDRELDEMDARLDKDVAAWSATIQRPGNQSRFAVARTPEGNVVGVATAAPVLDDQDRFETGAKWQLFTCYVDRSWHGSGVASRLVDFVLGDESAVLWVLEGNSRARAFYTKLGFIADGAREELPAEWAGAREVRMVRKAPVQDANSS